MQIGWLEVERLTHLLELESEGAVIDLDEARQLARRIAEIYPDVANSMDVLDQRMQDYRAA